MKSNVKKYRYPRERLVNINAGVISLLQLPLRSGAPLYSPPQSHRDVQHSDHRQVGLTASSMWPKFALKIKKK